MLVNAASYGASFAALRMIDGDRLRPAPVVTGPRRRGVLAALAYVRARPDLVLVFLCVFFVGAFSMNAQITGALMAQVEFGRGADAFGLLGSLLALGSVVGSLVVAGRRPTGVGVIAASALTLAGLQLVAALMPGFAAYAALMPLLGAAFLVAATVSSATVQLATEPELRGRVTSLYLLVFVATVPVVAPVIGWSGDEWGPRVAVALGGLISGVGVTGSCVWYLLQRARRSGRGERTPGRGRTV